MYLFSLQKQKSDSFTLLVMHHEANKVSMSLIVSYQYFPSHQLKPAGYVSPMKRIQKDVTATCYSYL